MKRIAIFCDGTWNEADAKYPTNVVKLAQALSPTGADGGAQQPVYIPGVGTGQGGGRFGKWIDKVGGGAFGWGLEDKIVEAYKALVLSHTPGDQIYIFGFSRGAYTARSLAALLRSSAMPPRSRLEMVPEAVQHYRSHSKSRGPDGPEGLAFRHAMNPALVTSPAEAAWRADNNLAPGVMLNIAYLGIWDTVGALGVPKFWGGVAKYFNKQYEFHNTDLSRSVGAARHAVAIDERRRAFPPTLWQNLEALNAASGGGGGAHYQQCWYPGVHGAVGGGGDIVALSNDPLLWVAEGANRAGLDFDQVQLDAFARARDYLGPLDNQSHTGGGILKKLVALNTRDRDGPESASELSLAARQRWLEADPLYRPRTLRRVARDVGP
ncbi:MAG: DUF2235 domain-containing protein [Paracoccaceae bacterium]